MKEKKNIQKQFGKHLKKVRLEKKMSGAELSKRTFIDRPHITRLEKGETNPTLYTIALLANALDMNIEEFFKDFD